MEDGKIKFDILEKMIQTNKFTLMWNNSNETEMRIGGGEKYVQERVLHKAAPHLTREAIEKNAKDNILTALKCSANLLSIYESSYSKLFVSNAKEEELKKNAIALLFGEGPLLDRINRFAAYAEVRPIEGDQKKSGFQPTVISYLMANSNPREYAFCKPKSYTSAVKALKGIDFIEKDKLKRLIDCSAFYKEILKYLEDHHGLKNGNLFDIHSLFYIFQMKQEGTKKTSWDEILDDTPQTSFQLKEDIKTFSMEDALSDLFIEKEELEYIISRLSVKKNIILQGPPGVGKTFIAKKLAYILMGEKNEKQIAMIQFHQSYSYEDFIQGFRPNREGRFDLRNGIFYEFCRKAQEDPANNYFFIIDEINRGNLGKIFGELFMLIEADKRGKPFAIPLTYSENFDQAFYLPENLYFIGTMNTADRSLAMVDYALRRRFSFIHIPPQFTSPNFQNYLRDRNVDEEIIKRIVQKMTQLNSKIMEDVKNLGPGYRIGHSYFCPTNNDMDYDEDWFTMIVRSEIEPLLQEYWFDNPKIVETLVNEILD